MKLYYDNQLLLDTDTYKLNLTLLRFEDYKGSSEKFVKTSSNYFNDEYVYRPKTYNGYSSKLEFMVRNIKTEEFENALFKANRLTLPKENGFYREFYISDSIEYRYVDDFTIYTVPIYLNAFKYFIDSETFNITDNRPVVIRNKGNVYAEPIYTIYGTGEIVFSVNGVRNVIPKLGNGATIDCRSGRQGIVNSNGVAINVSSDYSSEFSVLNTGENTVQLLKGAKLVVKVNWRKL